MRCIAAYKQEVYRSTHLLKRSREYKPEIYNIMCKSTETLNPCLCDGTVAIIALEIRKRSKR
eukprot:2625449-Lingulodinium_polyedra.AAC.1